MLHFLYRDKGKEVISFRGDCAKVRDTSTSAKSNWLVEIILRTLSESREIVNYYCSAL